jgi:hypothetical protein
MTMILFDWWKRRERRVDRLDLIMTFYFSLLNGFSSDSVKVCEMIDLDKKVEVSKKKVDA